MQLIGFDAKKAGKKPYMCLQNVRLGFGIPPKYDDAWTAWLHTEQHTDRDFPPLYVPIYFSFTTSIDGVRKNYGHIGVRYPDGQFWSDGKLYASVEAYENDYPPKFVGWGESINDVRVITLQGVAMAKPNINTLRIAHSEIGGWDLHKTHKGEYDQLFKDAAGHLEVNDFIYKQWVAGGKFREARERAFREVKNLERIVGTLESTNTELQKALGIKDAEIERLTARLAAKGDDKRIGIKAAFKLFVQSVIDWFNK